MKPTYARIIGQIARQRRVLLEIDLATMAAKMKMSSSGWSRVETGDTTMTVEQLARAAKVLGVMPSSLVQKADECLMWFKESGSGKRNGDDERVQDDGGDRSVARCREGDRR